MHYEKQFKFLIGADRGNEGKGEICQHFCQTMNNPIVIMNDGIERTSSHYSTRKHDRTYNLSLSPSYELGKPFFITNTTQLDVSFLECELRYVDKFLDLPKLCYIDRNCNIWTPIDFIIEKYAETKDLSLLKRTKYTIKDLLDNCNDVCTKIFNEYKNYYNLKDFSELYNLKIDGFCETDYDLQTFNIAVEYLKDKLILSSFDEVYDKFDSFIFLNNGGILDKHNDMSHINKYLLENNININNECHEVIYVTKSDNLNIKDLITRCSDDSKTYNWCIAVTDFKYNSISNEHIKYIINKIKENIVLKLHCYNTHIKDTKLLLQHNHNSGLTWEIWNNMTDVKNLSFMPFRLDYPCKRINWTICNSKTYRQHVDQMIDNNCYKHCLQLLDKDFVIDKQRLKDFYIDKCQFKTFITASLKQAEDIKDLDPDSHVIYYGDNPVESKFIDDIILPSDYEGKLPKHFGIRMDNHNIDDVMCKWYGQCDFLFLEYDVWFQDDVLELIDKYKSFCEVLNSLQNTSNGV